MQCFENETPTIFHSRTISMKIIWYRLLSLLWVKAPLFQLLYCNKYTAIYENACAFEFIKIKSDYDSQIGRQWCNTLFLLGKFFLTRFNEEELVWNIDCVYGLNSTKKMYLAVCQQNEKGYIQYYTILYPLRRVSLYTNNCCLRTVKMNQPAKFIFWCQRWQPEQHLSNFQQYLNERAFFFTKINASNFTEHVFLQSGLHVHLSWCDCPKKIPVKKNEISQFCTDFFFLVKSFSVEF